LPAEQRYLEVCSALQAEIAGVPALFDEVVGGLLPWISIPWLHFLCHWILWGVHNPEENAELRGISHMSGIPMYLLICFNVLLDLFMGCSSGGASIAEGPYGSKMLHFRTLDWGMPALRRVVVQLDFVTTSDGPVVASSLTYAGFVGVLTGVRRDLSMSLNFRHGRQDSGKLWNDMLYWWNLTLVLLGWRPSIASILRDFLLSGDKSTWSSRPSRTFTSPWTYEDIVAQLQQERTFASTACYLCFCSGKETAVIEKDRVSASVRTSDEFIVVTNSDHHADATCRQPIHKPIHDDVLQEIVEEAVNRRRCAERNWQVMRAEQEAMNVQDVIGLVQRYPTTNETTHFACVMDPDTGRIVWCRSWKKSVGARWIREHA
jgi:hypothetical protein